MLPGSPKPDIPDYELLRKIGTGSYGDVWLARGITGAFRAVKVVWRERFDDIRPYEREFDGITRFAVISLREPSQLALLHAGRNDGAGFFYYVMELADDAEQGRTIDPDTYVPCTLRELFARRGRFPVVEVVSLGTGLARAVGTLHRAGLVHRDIKPSNVILVGGVPKLADVGLVAAASAGAMTFVGTEGFVPPEGPGAPSADVFSLGKLLYELATGHDRNDFPRLPEGFGRWPDRRALLELNEILLRACEPDARRRFEDGEALLEELLLLQAGKSVRRLRKIERSLGRTIRLAGALALIAAVAGIGAWVERQRANVQAELRQQAEAERDALARFTVYAATLAQVQRALEHEDYGRARELLQAAAPADGGADLRGFEWRYLWRKAQGDPSVMIHEGNPVEKIALSSDARLLASHDSSGVVSLFNASDFKTVGRVEGVARLGGFDPTGEWLLGAGTHDLRRWRVSDGSAEVATAPGGVCLPIGVDGAGRLVAAVTGRPARVVVWDFSQNLAVVDIPLGESTDEPPREFFRGALSPDGGRALIACVIGRSASVKFELFALDLVRGEMVSLGPPPVRPGAVGWMFDVDDEIRWWIADDATGAWATAGDCSGPWVASDEFLPAGISSLGGAGGIKVITAGAALTSEREGTRSSHKGTAGTIRTSAMHPDGKVIFTGSSAGELRAWESLRDRSAVPEFHGWRSQTLIAGAELSPNGNSLFAQEGETVVVELDPATLLPLRRIEDIRKIVTVTSDKLWGVSGDGLAVVAIDLRTGEVVEELGRGASQVVQAVLSANGHRVVFTRQNGELCSAVLSESGWEPVSAVAGSHHNYWAIRLDRNGDRYWCVTIDRKVQCRTLPEAEVVWSVPIPAISPELIRVPSLRMVAVALESGEIQFHDEATGAHVSSLSSGSSPPEGMVVSTDGMRLHTLTVAGDLQTYVLPGRFLLSSIPTGLDGPAHNVSISADDTRIAVSNKRGVVRVLDAR
ncbi:MAG TPA: WD40 repeat domain-containing serine/threonine protein kinase [Opitutaceae bacterium]|nr:WD40 repeat domain-containing serine/threonine protein kinase [Opitutaceae bacterium]